MTTEDGKEREEKKKKQRIEERKSYNSSSFQLLVNTGGDQIYAGKN